MNKSKDAKEWSNPGGREHSPRTGCSGGEPSATEWWIRGNRAPRTGASGGVKRQAGNKHGDQTGTSGEEAHPDCNIRGAEAQERQENPGKKRPMIGAAGAAKGGGSGSGKKQQGNMNKSIEWWRGDTKSKSRQEGGEDADR